MPARCSGPVQLPHVSRAVCCAFGGDGGGGMIVANGLGPCPRAGDPMNLGGGGGARIPAIYMRAAHHLMVSGRGCEVATSTKHVPGHLGG
jgi:hypothetical protein